MGRGSPRRDQRQTVRLDGQGLRGVRRRVVGRHDHAARRERGLEDRKHPMSFSPTAARESLGRIVLRAHDRRRPDFADVPGELDLTLEQNAAWDTYCAGRLARMGVETNQQRWRDNHRYRFGFDDDVDAMFDHLWSADDLGTRPRPVLPPTTFALQFGWSGSPEVQRERDWERGGALRRRGGAETRSACASRDQAPCLTEASDHHGCRPTTRTD